MSNEQTISLEHLQELKDAAFREGALACLEVVDTIVFIVEQKQGPLNLLREKLGKLDAAIMEFHRADLKQKLCSKVFIYLTDFAEKVKVKPQ